MSQNAGSEEAERHGTRFSALFLGILSTQSRIGPGCLATVSSNGISLGDRDRNLYRSLSEYLLVLSHGRWISLGFGLFGLGPTLCAHYPPQSTPTLQERRQIFKRLWVKHISCHSADTFSRPRNRNLRIPRADLIMPNTGSTMCLRAA